MTRRSGSVVFTHRSWAWKPTTRQSIPEPRGSISSRPLGDDARSHDDATELVGLGDSLIAVIALYGLVIVASVLLPDFAVSRRGRRSACRATQRRYGRGRHGPGRQGAVRGVLLSSAAVWWVAGLLTHPRS